MNCVRSKDAQKQLARTTLTVLLNCVCYIGVTSGLSGVLFHKYYHNFGRVEESVRLLNCAKTSFSDSGSDSTSLY